MQSNTTTNAALATLVTDLCAALDKAENELGPEPVLTTASEKRRRAKPRKGAEKVLTQLAPIVKQYDLESGALNADDMMTAHETAQTLVPLLIRLGKISKRVSDQAFGAQTEAWEMGLQFYALLKRRAKSDGQVATSIAPLAAAFAFRHPLVKAKGPTKTQTRVKERLKKVLALAEKHGVTVAGLEEGEGTGAGTGEPALNGAGGEAGPSGNTKAHAR